MKNIYFFLLLISLLGAGSFFYLKRNSSQIITPQSVTPGTLNIKNEGNNGEKVIKEERIIVAFGDSLTAGYNLPEDSSYPVILQKKIQEKNLNYRVINAGISGDTTTGGLARIDWVLKSKPEIVILELGANDAFRLVPPEKIRENLEKILEKLSQQKVKVLLAGMKAPRNLGVDYAEQFDQIYPDLAKKYDLALIPFFLNQVAMKPELNLEDGIHPNEKGYQIVADTVWRSLEKMLKDKDFKR